MHVFPRISLVVITLVLFWLGCSLSPNQITSNQEIVIKGKVTTDETLSYRNEPFQVPENIAALEVSYTFSGKGKNEIEIGIADPKGFRGTSRFSKTEFYIGKYSATPSYLPGKIGAGEWNITLAFPTIREDADYEIHVKMISEESSQFRSPSTNSLSDSTKWYAGDFHTHTGHSDGFGCKDTRGNRAPCQVSQVAEAASNNNLDFVAIADHNTISHYSEIRALQTRYPDMLLMRGQEITTFYGHANVFGSGVPLNYAIGFNGYTANDLQQKAAEVGALLSLNHPGRESGASCTGCGWTENSIDYSILEAIEIVNGTDVGSSISGIPFWENLLNQGHRIIGIGGSDDHGAGTGSDKPGTPTTMVFAHNLSESGLIEGVRSGNVYIKTKGSLSPDIEFYASSGNKKWVMGEVIPYEKIHEEMELNIEYNGGKEFAIEFIQNGNQIPITEAQRTVSKNKRKVSIPVAITKKGWIRFNLRDESGISVISNPIFFQ